MTGPGVNSSLNAVGPATHSGKVDPLAKLNAEVKSGQVQLDDTEFNKKASNISIGGEEY
jgi:hypothetical protein